MADASPWLLVGLGNPGSKYAGHRHNVGFMAVESWIDGELPLPAAWSSKHQGEVAQASGRFGRCVVLKPQTFMNRSGASVGDAARYFRVPIEQILVVHDELDFEMGRVGIKRGGGHGGHNGLRDMIAHLGSREFGRVRVGIGRPPHGDVSRWVLSDYSREESSLLDEQLRQVNRAISLIFNEGYPDAMKEINTPPAKKKSKESE